MLQPALRDRLIVAPRCSPSRCSLLSMITPLQFNNWQWLTFALAWPVVLWGAWPFHRAAWMNLRHGAATMDTLISVGTLAAFGWSVYALFWGTAGMPNMKMSFSFTIERGGGQGEIYLEVASRGHRVHPLRPILRIESQAHAPVPLCGRCSTWAPKTSPCSATATRSRIPIGQLAVGDLFVVRPGEKIATDGIVEEGSSAIDASLLTGESVPVEVAPGSPVTGATVNAGGRLIVRATRVGADTALAQIARLVTEAQNGKATVQRLADQISAVFVPVVIALAIGTLGFWLGTGETAPALVHRRRRRPDHRLPVRTRSGHADRTARRHRTRRAARDPHQGTTGPRIDPPDRHHRARQDRHRHHRPDDTRRCRHRRRHRPRRGAPPRRCPRGRLRAPHRPGDRQRRPRAASAS